MAKTDAKLTVSSADPAIQSLQTTMDKFLDTARVEHVYGQPIEHGDNLIIPCAEVLSGFGYGIGYGSGSAPEGEEAQAGGSGSGGGGGGGGRTFARPAAVIIASPQGVRVEPVVDVTKIGLAALTTGMFMFAMLARLSRPRKLLKDMRDLEMD